MPSRNNYRVCKLADLTLHRADDIFFFFREVFRQHVERAALNGRSCR